MEVLGHFALQDEALRAYVVPKPGSTDEREASPFQHAHVRY